MIPVIPTSKMSYLNDSAHYDTPGPWIKEVDSTSPSLAHSGENRSPYASSVKLMLGQKEYTMDLGKYTKLAASGVPNTNAMMIAATPDNPATTIRDSAMSSLENARAGVSPYMQQATNVPAANYTPVQQPYQPPQQMYQQPQQAYQPLPQPYQPPQYQPQPAAAQPANTPRAVTSEELTGELQALRTDLYQALDLILNPVNELVAVTAAKQAADMGQPPQGVFGPTAGEPGYQVYFDMGALGTMSATYHDVVVAPQAIVLAYDVRFRHHQYVPPVSSADLPPWKVTVVDVAGNAQGPFSCVSLGLQFNMGHVDFVVLLRDGSSPVGGPLGPEA